MADRTIPERRALKRALREAGLSARQTDALLREGYRGLVGEAQAELAELQDRFESVLAAIENRPQQG